MRSGGGGEYKQPEGRWPANLILEEEAGELVNQQSGVSQSKASMRGAGIGGVHDIFSGGNPGFDSLRGHSDAGGASRFFYCAKVDTEERESWTTGNNHPTLKPKDLNRYLAKMMLPPGADRRILVPYSGAGSEVIGAILGGWDEAVGIDDNSAYVEIAEQRCRRWLPELFE
jgi:site-specific DNA-methyltransferase (adenine-specific)